MLRWNRLRYNSWGWSHRETVLFAKKALKYAKLRSVETKEPIKVTWEDYSRAMEDINGKCRWYFMCNHETQITAKWLTDLWRTDVVQKLAEYGDVGIKGYIGGVTGAMGQNHVNREQIATNIAHMKKMEAHADENSKMQKESLDIQQQIHEAQQQALKEQFEMQQKALAAQQQALEEQQKFNKEQKEKLEEAQSAKNIALNAAIAAAAATTTQGGLGLVVWSIGKLFGG